jgi:hypothetical protein
MHKPTHLCGVRCAAAVTPLLLTHKHHSHRHHMVSRQPTLCHPPQSHAVGLCTQQLGTREHNCQYSMLQTPQQHSLNHAAQPHHQCHIALCSVHRKTPQHSWLRLWPTAPAGSSLGPHSDCYCCCSPAMAIIAAPFALSGLQPTNGKCNDASRLAMPAEACCLLQTDWPSTAIRWRWDTLSYCIAKAIPRELSRVERLDRAVTTAYRLPWST